jgi:hypothetical protein
MKKQIKGYSGILLIILGSIILIVSSFTSLKDYNAVLFGALFIEIVGLYLQIRVQKKTKPK